LTTNAATLPAPLVKFGFRTFPKWTWNRTQLIVWLVIFSFFGLLVFAGLYYAVFQTTDTVKQAWHGAFSDDATRHNIRDVGEGFFGGLFGLQVVWNHYKKRKALTAFERRLGMSSLDDDKPMSIWRTVYSYILAIPYAVPGFCAGLLLIAGVHHGITHWGLGTSLQEVGQTTLAPSLWSKLESFVTDNWEKKVLGYGAALFFGRRPVRGVFDDLQLWVVEQLARHGKAVAVFLPPTFRARYNDVVENGVSAPRKWDRLRSITLVALVGVAVGLAGLGAYVFMFIA
jgi:hypothetical protein